jgi:protein-disulfide isomerase
MGSSKLRILFFGIIAAGVFVFIVMFNVNVNTSQAEGITEEEVKKIISQYIKQNPQEIIDSLTQHQISQQREQEQNAQANLKQNLDEIKNNPVDPIAGNPQGDVTVVEFFDYSCGYCKKIMPYIAEIIKTDPNVKVVFKELPILGPNSFIAAQASLAVNMIAPDKYFDYHAKLMSTRVSSKASVLKIADELGIDSSKVEEKMSSQEVQSIIAANKKLAEEVGIRGTPAIVIGEQLYPGAIDLATFQKEIARVRSE